METTSPVMSISDEQIADLEGRMDTAEQGYGESAYISNETCRSLISRLRAAERNAERYRWLVESCVGGNVEEAGNGPFIYHGTPWNANWRRELEDAIDTAMKGDQQ